MSSSLLRGRLCVGKLAGSLTVNPRMIASRKDGRIFAGVANFIVLSFL